jgi:2-polyprenyl-6-hydroxyphenyl methylase/3-demethylubiquinone-9 3-methyltransferase
MNHPIRWRIAQHVEQYWWRRYLHDKDWPTYHQWKCNYWNTLIGHATAISPELAKLVDDSTISILDAGCGPAGVYMVLDEHPVTAIDPLIETYAYWLEHFKTSVFPWVDFRNIPLEQFKCREPFELVFCMNALNHVADIELATEKLVAATSQNGVIVITWDAHNYSVLQKLFRLVPGDILHPHQYTLNGYVHLFNCYGLQLQGNLTLRKGRLFNHELLVFKKI